MTSITLKRSPLVSRLPPLKIAAKCLFGGGRTPHTKSPTDVAIPPGTIEQEPVSTSQVSSGRLESTTALKGTEKVFASAGDRTRASGLPVQCANHYTTESLVLFACNPEYLLQFSGQSSSDKSDWAPRPHSIAVYSTHPWGVF